MSDRDNMIRLPNEGMTYFFFRDGSHLLHDIFYCKVKKIIPFSEVVKDPKAYGTLLDSWNTLKEEDDSYSNTTDAFIIGVVPKLTVEMLAFVRASNGQWKSLGISSPWHIGILNLNPMIASDIQRKYRQRNIDLVSLLYD